MDLQFVFGNPVPGRASRKRKASSQKRVAPRRKTRKLIKKLKDEDMKKRKSSRRIKLAESRRNPSLKGKRKRRNPAVVVKEKGKEVARHFYPSEKALSRVKIKERELAKKLKETLSGLREAKKEGNAQKASQLQKKAGLIRKIQVRARQLHRSGQTAAQTAQLRKKLAQDAKKAGADISVHVIPWVQGDPKEDQPRAPGRRKKKVARRKKKKAGAKRKTKKVKAVAPKRKKRSRKAKAVTPKRKKRSKKAAAPKRKKRSKKAAAPKRKKRSKKAAAPKRKKHSRRNKKVVNRAVRLYDRVLSARKGDTIRVKKKRGKKRRVLKVKNPLGGKMAKVAQKFKEYTGHSLAEAGGLLAGGAGLKAAEKAVAKGVAMLPASVQGILSKVPSIEGLVVAGALSAVYARLKPGSDAAEAVKGMIGASVAKLSSDLLGKTLGLDSMTAAAPTAGVRFVPDMSGVKFVPDQSMRGVDLRSWGKADYDSMSGVPSGLPSGKQPDFGYRPDQYSPASDFGAVPEGLGMDNIVDEVSEDSDHTM